ncbi:uncharacterized protein LOC127703095 [Mytilus californianus]|uniref:uncharacterized protein LOC127703095 n=1 Tax=Mytilus californianus TaxID=6549 RepID=UPI00224591C9|nr:uncharacterized protein LOC127703095 [Mytilus californianus]XP_052063480.1 uncharacterized protein LOC127703095 [Mytilus californianus]
MTANCLYWVFFMQTLVLTLGKLAINTTCYVKGSPCTISCSILNFTKLASWSRDNKRMTSCTKSGNTTFFCDKESTQIYSFSANRSGIYVAISDLTSNEIGAKWICSHGVDTPVRISINIPERDQIYKSGLSGGSIAGIVIGVLVPVISGIIIIVILVFLKRKKDDNVPFNQMDKN